MLLPKITIVTPSVRLEGLEMVMRCLKRQTFKAFEWLIVSPFSVVELDRELDHFDYTHIEEPSKNEGDYYNLNKAWNETFRQARGDLVVSIVDLLWFPSDVLERLWIHYTQNPKVCISTVGNQYEVVENGKPELIVWGDPRMRKDFGTFYEISPNDMELCLASIPRQAILDVGGVDEEYDKYAALSEKELCYRIEKLGYKFYIDQSIEYRAMKHSRLTKEWDERYFAGWTYHEKCLKEIMEGKRLKLAFV